MGCTVYSDLPLTVRLTFTMGLPFQVSLQDTSFCSVCVEHDAVFLPPSIMKIPRYVEQLGVRLSPELVACVTRVVRDTRNIKTHFGSCYTQFQASLQ